MIASLFVALGLVAPAEVEALEKAFAAKAELYAPAPGYSEGPTWYKGSVYFCSGALLRISPERKVTRYLDISPAGTYLLADGSILICDNKYHALLQLSPDGK